MPELYVTATDVNKINRNIFEKHLIKNICVFFPLSKPDDIAARQCQNKTLKESSIKSIQGNLKNKSNLKNIQVIRVEVFETL